MQSQTIVFFGIAGSGKGTQMDLLRDFLKEKDVKECLKIGPGTGFRKILDTESYTANLIRDSLLRGELQPDFLTNSLVANDLIAHLTIDKHLLVDGYPRTVVQAQTFESMMKFYKRRNVKIIYIKVGKPEAIERSLSRGREDDTRDSIAKRFDEYEDNVLPAMEYLQSKADEGYEVYTINGEQTIADVHSEIIKTLKF